jgi:hypothetical protein
MLIIKGNGHAIATIEEKSLLDHAITFAAFHGLDVDHLRVWLANPEPHKEKFHRYITGLAALEPTPAIQAEALLLCMINALVTQPDEAPAYIAALYPEFGQKVEQHVGQRIAHMQLEVEKEPTGTIHWADATRLAYLHLTEQDRDAANLAAAHDQSGEALRQLAVSAHIVDDLNEDLLQDAWAAIDWPQIAAALIAQR